MPYSSSFLLEPRSKLDFDLINKLNMNEIFKITNGNSKQEDSLNQLKEQYNKAKEDITKSEDELSVDDLMSKIKELNEMYKSGVISKEEFEMLKGKLLKNL